MKTMKSLLATAIVSTALLASSSAFAADKTAVKITSELASVDVMHGGKKATITRNQNQKNTVNPAFAKTSRKCPPFCIQPMLIVPGVETVGELEVLGYLKRMNDGDRTVMVVDSRTPDWTIRGTIPGSVNIPWNKINVDVEGTFAVETEAETLNDIL